MRNRKGSVPEREIHVRLWDIFKNVIFKEKFEFEDTQFVDIKVEPNINGRPDLVIEAVEKTRAKKMPLLVIETKRKVPYRDPRFDPYSIDVIKQAVGYANQMGAPYFATCNGEIMVVFETFKPGVPLIQRRMKQYKVFFEDEFARIVLKELVRFKLGVGRWLPLDDLFVERLRSFHRFITPLMYDALTVKLKEDDKFKKEYIRWLKSQMFEYSNKVNETIAEQISYLLMNKIAFYKTLENQIVDVDIDKLHKIETKNGADFSKRLQGKFKQLTKKADYEGIFQPTILDSVSVPDKLVYHLNQFIEELDAYNLGRIRADIIGRVYEDLIPADERHRLGQYYTPPPIVDLIVELCIKSPDDKILDPGCGSGSFLVKAYHKLRDLKKKQNPFRKDEELHQELLEQVYGIDINPFPAQLSSMNLAIRNLKVRSRHINIFPMDFFKVKPRMALLPKELDVVVANPPYTDWREMEHRDRIRDVALRYKKEIINVGKQAGIYAYFFTHGAKFLKDGGMMGQIVSDAWLDMGYGVGLKEFFMNFFKIKAIIGHDTGVFDRPLINTAIVILEEAEDSEVAREENKVKFVRLKKSSPIQKVINIVETAKETFENSNFRVRIMRQGDLKPKEPWGVYLRAPMLYFAIIEHPLIVELSKLCKTRIGLQTFADKFYILDKENVKEWGIEEKYLRKIITSPRLVSGITLKPHDVNEYVLVCSDVKADLQDKNVLNYIEWGEQIKVKVRKKDRLVKGFDQLPRVEAAKRKPWYNLEREIQAKGIAPIIYPYMVWERVSFIMNTNGVIDHQNFIGIKPKHEEMTLPLLGILNSSLTEFTVRCVSHIYGGGVAKLRPSDVRRLKVLDVEEITPTQREKLRSKFLDVVKGSKGSKEDLDRIVFDILNLDKKSRMKILRTIEELKKAQQVRKDTDVLVETAEKWEPRKKAKGRRKKAEEAPSKRLDTWMKD